MFILCELILSKYTAESITAYCGMFRPCRPVSTVCMFCVQWAKAYKDETSCNQLLLILLCACSRSSPDINWMWLSSCTSWYIRTNDTVMPELSDQHDTLAFLIGAYIPLLDTNVRFADGYRRSWACNVRWTAPPTLGAVLFIHSMSPDTSTSAAVAFTGQGGVDSQSMQTANSCKQLILCMYVQDKTPEGYIVWTMHDQPVHMVQCCSQICWCHENGLDSIMFAKCLP